jgi:hypothetical protein
MYFLEAVGIIAFVNKSDKDNTVPSKLMQLDEVVIQKEYQIELDRWIINLRESLNQYL